MTCSTVVVPVQLLESHKPPLLFQTVMPIVSVSPASPLSIIVTFKVALPSTDTGTSGFVMSVMLACGRGSVFSNS